MKRLMMKTIIDYQNDEREKVLLDVRDKQEFEKETYPGARNWYWEELIKVLDLRNSHSSLIRAFLYIFCAIQVCTVMIWQIFLKKWVMRSTVCMAAGALI